MNSKVTIVGIFTSGLVGRRYLFPAFLLPLFFTILFFSTRLFIYTYEDIYVVRSMRTIMTQYEPLGGEREKESESVKERENTLVNCTEFLFNNLVDIVVKTNLN